MIRCCGVLGDRDKVTSDVGHNLVYRDADAEQAQRRKDFQRLYGEIED